MPTDACLALTLRYDLAEITRANRAADAFCAEHHVSDQARYTVQLAIEETVSNVIKYGFCGSADQTQPIDLSLRVEDRSVVLVVCDRARPFHPDRAPRPDLDAPIEQRRVGGLGLHLLRTMAESIDYQRDDDGRNRLTVHIASEA